MENVIIDELNDTLQEWYVIDQSKKEINKFERAKILRNFMKNNKYSFRDMEKKFNIKKGTLSGWLKWNTITPTEYVKMKKKGITETQINNVLKHNKPINITESKFEVQIDTLLFYIQQNSFKITNNTLNKVRDLRNKLNYILYKNERKDKYN